MEPTLSTIHHGVCSDRVTSAALESALLYFKPREVLAVGPLSPPVARLLRGYAAAAAGGQAGVEAAAA